MIRINLLPPHLRPIKRTPLPHLASIAVAALAVLAMLYFFIGMQSRIGAARAELADTNASLKQLESTVNEHNELNAKKLSLRDKVAVIEEILSDRIIWSEQLHRLVQLTPDNVWYSELNITTQGFPERRMKMDPKTQKPAVDPQTKQPVYETVTVKRRVLEVTGYAVSGETGEANISPLVNATATDLEFSQTFKLIRPRIEDTEFDGFAVRGFTLEYLIETPGDVAEANKTATAAAGAK